MSEFLKRELAEHHPAHFGGTFSYCGKIRSVAIVLAVLVATTAARQ